MALTDRLLRRLGLQRVAQKRWTPSYAGAQINRLTLDWIRSPLSADKELDGSLDQLRARSRDLVRNNAYARRFVQMAQNHIAGPYGVRLQAKNSAAKGRNAGKLDEKLNAHIEAEWSAWGKPDTCTLAGRLSWTETQRLIIGATMQDGEVLVQLVPADNRWQFAVHLIDPDQLDANFNRKAGREGPEVRMGVEVNEFGRPLAYHLVTSHPSEVGVERKRVRIPARDIIHVALPGTRINQTRSVPAFAPVMIDLRHFSGGQEAEVVAMRAAASKLGFIVTKDQDGEAATPAPGQQMTMSGDPFTVEHLDVGQEFQPWESNHPNGNFPEFARTILRSVAAGLGTSYAGLAQDLRESNYSSMRVGRLEEQDTWCALQQWFIDHVVSRVFERWLESAVLAGSVVVPQFDITRANVVEWRPRRWASVDPAKDLDAFERGVKLGVNSRTKILGGTGDDIEDVFADLEREQELAKAHKIDIEGESNAKAGPQGAAEADAGADGGAGSTGKPGGGGRANPDLTLVRAAGEAVLGHGDPVARAGGG